MIKSIKQILEVGTSLAKRLGYYSGQFILFLTIGFMVLFLSVWALVFWIVFKAIMDAMAK